MCDYHFPSEPNDHQEVVVMFTELVVWEPVSLPRSKLQLASDADARSLSDDRRVTMSLPLTQAGCHTG